MSDTAQGPGWWLASDGRWYPPETHPHYQGTIPPPLPYEAYDQPATPVAAQAGLPSFSAVVPPSTRAPARPDGPQFVVVGLGDGRQLQAMLAGPEWGIPLVWHHGTPFAAAPRPVALAAAAGHGLRTITVNRPGYAGSTDRPGRTVADAAADTAELLDHLGHDRFLSVGWSGGGPHALACAALLGERCMAVATIGGVAPADAQGLDWLKGMGPENVEEFTAARAGGAPFTSFLERSAAVWAEVAGPELAESLGGLVSAVDRTTLTPELADFLAASVRAALSGGVEGWREDDLAFVAPWGFDPGGINTPAAVWLGGQDLMVPPSHGAWLAGRMPSARRWLLPDEGHLSVVVDVDRVLRDLLDLAGSDR